MMSAEIPAFGMVKDVRHRTRGLVSDKGEIELSPTGSVFKLITAIQDEAHRSAITHHRKQHGAAMTKSELDGIKGVGEKRKTALLRHFKSIDAIKAASVEELCAGGVDRATAENIRKHY